MQGRIGIQFAPMQGRIGIQFALTLANHYPERLGRLILLNPPRVFDLLLAACKPFVSARTMDKVIRCVCGVVCV